MGKERKRITDIIKQFRLRSIFSAILLSMTAMSIFCMVMLSVFFVRRIVEDNHEHLDSTNQVYLNSLTEDTNYLIESMLHQSIVQLSYSHSILSLATAQNFSNQDINLAAADISFAAKYNTLIDSVILYYPEKEAVYLSDYSKYTLEEYPGSSMIADYLEGRIPVSKIKNNSKITSLFSYGEEMYLAFDFPLHGEKRLATLFYVIDMEEVFSRIQDSGLNGEMVWVYDRDGNPIFEEWADYPESITPELVAELSGSKSLPVEKDTEYYFYSSSQTLGWSYICILTSDYFNISILDVLMVALPVLLIVLIFSIIGSYLVAARMYRPFKKLLSQVERNTQNKELIDRSKSEMEYLNLAISNMGAHNQKLSDMMTQVSEDVTKRLFMELFMGGTTDYKEAKELLISIGSPFKVNASYVSSVLRVEKDLSQDPNLRNQIYRELDKLLSGMKSNKRMHYQIIYEEGQTYAVVFAFDVNESTLTMKRSMMEIEEAVHNRMKLLNIPAVFSSGNIYHSIMDVGFSYSEAYKRLGKKQKKQEAVPVIQEEKTAAKPVSEEARAEAASEEKREIQEVSDDSLLRIQHMISMIQMDNLDGAEELIERVVRQGTAKCAGKEELIRYYLLLVSEFSDEIVKMKTVNMAAFPAELFDVSEETLREYDEELLKSELERNCREILENLSRILKKKQNHFFVATKDYIHEHYKEGDLSLNVVAEAIGANPSYISRLFKEILGISFTNYLTNCRLESSLQFLADKDLPIREVAEESGFNTVQNYMRLFKKAYGMTPGQYREGKIPD